MSKWRIDRTAIFLFVIAFLFLWDVADYPAIRDPALVSHPFRIFRLLGVSEHFLGFLSMLRHIILFFVSGGVLGIAIGALMHRNSSLTRTALRFLRLGLWLPFLFLFTSPHKAFVLNLPVALLSSCYHYLAARSLLELSSDGVLRYVGRETFLQVLLFSLISQLWLGAWQWYDFTSTFETATGFKVLAILLIFIGLINWVFRSNFDLTAGRRETIISKELNNADRRSLVGAVLVTIICILFWQIVNQSQNPAFRPSPLHVLKAGYSLVGHGELWGDIGLSLLEIAVGFALAGLMTLFGGMWTTGPVRKSFVHLLPLTYISPVVLYLLLFIYARLSFAADSTWIYFWHKVVLVGFLTLFPLVQALWSLRDRPMIYRVLLALDDALPIAFVMMLFGEAFAATQGLGFMMIAASATYQTDKALVGFLITTALLVSLSATLRSIAKRLYSPKPSGEAVPVGV